jgi:hypothetical protein
MPNKTHRALPRYKISDFFRSLLEDYAQFISHLRSRLDCDCGLGSRSLFPLVPKNNFPNSCVRRVLKCPVLARKGGSGNEARPWYVERYLFMEAVTKVSDFHQIAINGAKFTQKKGNAANIREKSSN